MMITVNSFSCVYGDCGSHALELTLDMDERQLRAARELFTPEADARIQELENALATTESELRRTKAELAAAHRTNNELGPRLADAEKAAARASLRVSAARHAWSNSSSWARSSAHMIAIKEALHS